MNHLKREFFARDTVAVTRDLIGKLMVHETDLGNIEVIINEAEAYTQDEPSCHAFGGRTHRNRAMFEEPGTVYIYKIYGMHQCINFSTERAERGCAVLLRGVLPRAGQHLLAGTGRKIQKLLDGPSKLVKNMKIPFEYYGLNVCDEDCPLKIYDIGLSPTDLKETPRIGITKATELLWRFIAKNFESTAQSQAQEDEEPPTTEGPIKRLMEMAYQAPTKRARGASNNKTKK